MREDGAQSFWTPTNTSSVTSIVIIPSSNSRWECLKHYELLIFFLRLTRSYPKLWWSRENIKYISNGHQWKCNHSHDNKIVAEDAKLVFVQEIFYTLTQLPYCNPNCYCDRFLYYLFGDNFYCQKLKLLSSIPSSLIIFNPFLALENFWIAILIMALIWCNRNQRYSSICSFAVPERLIANLMNGIIEWRETIEWPIRFRDLTCIDFWVCLLLMIQRFTRKPENFSELKSFVVYKQDSMTAWN